MTTATVTRDEALVRLEAANAIRAARAEFRRRVGRLTLSGGCLVVAELIEDPPEWAATWAAFGALMTIRGFGHGKVTHALTVNGVSSRFRLGNLTARQRRALVAWLRERGGGA